VSWIWGNGFWRNGRLCDRVCAAGVGGREGRGKGARVGFTAKKNASCREQKNPAWQNSLLSSHFKDIVGKDLPPICIKAKSEKNTFLLETGRRGTGKCKRNAPRPGLGGSRERTRTTMIHHGSTQNGTWLVTREQSKGQGLWAGGNGIPLPTATS